MPKSLLTSIALRGSNSQPERGMCTHPPLVQVCLPPKLMVVACLLMRRLKGLILTTSSSSSKLLSKCVISSKPEHKLSVARSKTFSLQSTGHRSLVSDLEMSVRPEDSPLGDVFI